MLDIVRRSKGLSRVLLGLVVVGVASTFVVAIFAVWGGGVTSTAQGADWIMQVDGVIIPAREFQQRRAAVERDLREQLGGQQFDEQTLANLADQQALGGILSFHLAQREAERAGLEVTPAEVSETIRKMPVFQRDGRFVGVESYRKFLNAQGIEMATFESQVAEELAADKIRLALFGIARADGQEIERRFREQVERADVAYVLLPDTKFASAASPSESDLKGWYDRNSGSYMTEEARNASFVLFDREARAAAVEISDEELRQAYEAAKTTKYTHGDQVRASHILLRLDPAATQAEEAAQESAANEILASIRSGADFEQLARERSDDTVSARAGGDLGWFERGRMVQEFEDVAFSLAPESVSDVFRTPFGYHIVKVTGKRPSGTSTFEEVREDLRREAAVRKAQEEIRQAADDFTTRLAAQTSSFQTIAQEMGLTVEQTGPFNRGQPAGRLGRLPLVEDAVFALSPGSDSAAVAVPQGLAVFHLDTVDPPRPQSFDEVRDRVEEDWKSSRTRELARAEAGKILERQGDLEAKVKGKSLEVAKYANVTRVQPMPPLTDAAKEAALLADVGAIVGPFDSPDGVLLIEVLSRAPASQEEAAAERATLREQVMQENREVLFQSMMARIQKTSKIDINQALLRPGAVTQ